MFDLAYLHEQLAALALGTLVTLEVTLLSIVLSTAFGIIIGCSILLKKTLITGAIAAYVEAIRNTPILVQLYFIFYGLPNIGLTLSLFWSGVLCLTIWGTAYQIENMRGGLESLLPGYNDAAKALGLSQIVFFCLIALPLALRVALPSMANTAISLFKNSAYLQTIGLAELTFVAIDRISMDFRPVEMFAAILAIYLTMILMLSAASRRLEHFLNKPFEV